MVEYRYAFDQHGSLVDAEELARVDISPSSTFKCIVCDDQLIPKGKGTQKAPHFAHHPGATCREETYLHRLAKQVFHDVFATSVKDRTSFEIELTHETICHRYESIIGHPCNLKRKRLKTYDLTNYYNEIQLEKHDGQFVPDLLLLSKDRPHDKV